MIKVLWLLVGGGIGWLTMLLHIWSGAKIVPKASGHVLFWVVGGVLGRLALMGLGLTLALQQGIVEGFITFIGILGMRWLVIYRLHQGKAFEHYLK
jgi:hypothetical protein